MYCSLMKLQKQKDIYFWIKGFDVYEKQEKNIINNSTNIKLVLVLKKITSS